MPSHGNGDEPKGTIGPNESQQEVSLNTLQPASFHSVWSETNIWYALGCIAPLGNSIQMATKQQKVYLLTEAQRDALLSYLQNRPYKEVAVGIQFLMSAPTAVLNVQTSGEEENTSENDIAEGGQPNDVDPDSPLKFGG